MKLKYLIILISILQLSVVSASAQEIKKKQLTVKDYDLWQNISLNKLSSNGMWVSYRITYSNQIGRDTLFLKNTRTFKVLSFPGGKQDDFINVGWFSYYTDKGLHLVDLKKDQRQEVANSIKHIYSPISQSLVILAKAEKENVLVIRNPSGSISEKIKNVNDFTIDPTNQVVLYTSIINGIQMVNMLDLKHPAQKTILCNGAGTFRNFVWQVKGKAVAFMYRTADNTTIKNSIYYYTLTDKKLALFDSDLQIGFPKDSLFISDTGYNLKISDDMKRVFFSVKSKPQMTSAIGVSQVQLWNGNAKWIYPMEEMEKKIGGNHLALWRSSESTFLIVSNESLPKVMLTGDQQYAILSNPKQYEPQYAYDGDRDFYLLDLSSGRRSLFLKKQSGHPSYTIPSPTGKYVAYFKDKNWWIYNIANSSHTNITKNIGSIFYHNDKQQPQNVDIYPSLGWTTDDKQIVLCDEHDIWAINPDGKLARRLTQGYESQTEFRLAGLEFGFATKTNYNGVIHQTIDLNEGLLLLESKNRGVTSGYYKLSTTANERLIFSKNSRLNNLIKAITANTYVYLEQKFDIPPRIMIQTGSVQTAKIFVQSNLQHQQFSWGKSELIEYKNGKGENLNGILYYPSNYNPQKKYPMIVHIYEKLSKRIHDYINPSQYTGQENGFNIANFTTQGYFVLAPDISYEIGNVGISAADCVISATKEMINRGLVKPDKIGIIGHSFGGYETNFIITQTNLFAAAISGSGWADAISAYLTVGWNTGRPDMWRFESQQLRMGKSLFEDRGGYRRNSPLEYVEKITTPLLSWTGNEDVQVNWSQSIQFYLALCRLNKQHIMLLYPKERHNITNTVNLKDLSIRTHEWFDYYLKDEKPAGWIAKGTEIAQ